MYLIQTTIFFLLGAYFLNILPSLTPKKKKRFVHDRKAERSERFEKK